MSDAPKAEIRTAARLVEERSAELRKELRLGDLVLTQILYVVGLSWVGVAAKLGDQQLPFWLAAMALFYVPQAIVVMHLSRRYPLEGGLYQWSKIGLSRGIAFLVGWNLWLYAIVLVGAFGLPLANAIVYAVGPSAAALNDDKVYIAAITIALVGGLVWLSIRGLGVSKWIHNAGSVLLMSAFGLLLVTPFFGKVRAAGYHPLAFAPPALTLMSLNIMSKLAVGGLSGFEYIAVLAGETHDAKRNIARSVVIAAPVIALLFILGTSAVLAIVPPEQVDLIGPVPQALRVGLGESSAVAVLVPFAILAVISRNLGSASMLFIATTRMPMVAGWDNLMPAWFTKLHATYRTPINSILFIGACSLVFAAFGLFKVGVQEANQMLDNAAGIFYGLTYLALFGIPLFGLRGSAEPVPGWIKLVSAIGFLTTVLYVGFTLVPIVDVVSPLAFALKIGGLVVVANAIGLALYARSRRPSTVHRQP